MNEPLPDERAPVDEERAWVLLRELAKRARRGEARGLGALVGLDGEGHIVEGDARRAWFRTTSGASGMEWLVPGPPGVRELFELYLPLCLAAKGVAAKGAAFVLGHLGQSLDGKIATESGASRYVTSPENLRHLHRLRALSDAVLIGANTALADDPMLTTRLVPGDNPARVVIDPNLRLPLTLQIFSDGKAPTLVLAKRGSKRPAALPKAVELVELSAVEAGRFDPAQIVDELQHRGLQRILVEGGGITVSAFLRAGALNRMHVAVGSLIIGVGRPGIVMPPAASLEQALRPKTRRFFMGDDVLFDCELAPRA